MERLATLSFKEKRKFLAECFRSLRIPVGEPEGKPFPLRATLNVDGKEQREWRRLALTQSTSVEKLEETMMEMGLKYVRFDEMEAEFDFAKAFQWLGRMAESKQVPNRPFSPS